MGDRYSILTYFTQLPEGRALCAALPFHAMLNGIGIGIGVGVGVSVGIGIGIVHDMVDLPITFADRHIDCLLIAE